MNNHPSTSKWANELFFTDDKNRQGEKFLGYGETGCLAGETKLTVKVGSHYRRTTIRELWMRTHRIPHPRLNPLKWFWKEEPKIKSKVLGNLKYKPIVSVLWSGFKEAYRLTTSGGKTIEATGEHLFSTTEGWKPLKDLRWGDRIEVDANKHICRGRKGGRIMVYSLPYHPNAHRNFVWKRDYKRMPRAVLVIEARMNDLSLKDYIALLRTDNSKARKLKYLPKGSVVHHIDGNPKNDELSNLKVMDKQSHDAFHSIGNQHNSLRAIETETIQKIEPIGQKEVFDIVMEEANPSFVAEGIIVHNSGKTTFASTWPKPFFYDADGGLKTLENIHLPGVTVSYNDKEEPIDHCLRWMNMFKNREGPFAKGGNLEDRKTFVLDTISRLFQKMYLRRNEENVKQRDMKRATNIRNQQVSRYDPTWMQIQAAGFLISEVAEDITSKGYHFVMLAHTYEVTNEGGSVLEVLPELVGSSKKSILKVFNEVVYFTKVGGSFYAYPKGTSNKVWKVRTQSIKDLTKVDNPTYEKFYGKG